LDVAQISRPIFPHGSAQLGSWRLDHQRGLRCSGPNSGVGVGYAAHRVEKGQLRELATGKSEAHLVGRGLAGAYLADLLVASPGETGRGLQRVGIGCRRQGLASLPRDGELAMLYPRREVICCRDPNKTAVPLTPGPMYEGCRCPRVALWQVVLCKL